MRRSKECLELIKDSSSSAVSAPTGAGFGSSTLSTTTNSGTVRTLVKGVTDFAIVSGPTAVYVGWHYWDEAHNRQAQNRARELYCAAYPTDEVCGSGVSYWAVATGVSSWNCQMLQNAFGFQFEYCDDSSGYGSYYDLAHRLGGGIRDLKGPVQFLGFRQALDQFNQGCWFMDVLTADGYRSERQVCHYGPWFPPPGKMKFAGMLRTDGQPNTGGAQLPPPLPWKDWPQAKRDAAVALLNNSDWQRLITSMPFGGTLDPGDTVKAPKIVIPGQEWDNPNTLGDDRRLKTVPGEYARPVVPDFDHDSDPDETDADDDNDGFLDPYDTEPRNPYVPTASSEPPPPPDDDTPPQSEGERSVSDVRQSHGDFLEKAENDTFENRLDVVEGKYKRAAAMEEQANTDPDVGFEQQRLIDEADGELQQLRDEIQQAWWSSLSQAEQQLFRSVNSADVDEIRSHMEQWSSATFGQYAQTYEDAVARNILYHADKKGYSDPLEYLRDASNFDKARANRTPTDRTQYREDDTAKWDNPNNREYLVEDKQGKILTYGVNP